MREIIYTEPRDLDGDPYEVAAATASQAGAVLQLAARALNDTWVLARVAQMEREGETPNGAAFRKHPLGTRILGLEKEVLSIYDTLNKIIGAISYDPNNPPKEA